MFKLTTTAKNWKAVTSALSTLTEEAVLKITKESIECLTFDPSHTEGIGFSWKKENFTEFEVDFGDEEFKNLEISVPVLTNAFKRFADDAVVTVSSLTKGLMISDGVKEFSCAFYLGSQGEVQPPKVPYDNNFDLEISKVEEMITDCKVVKSDLVYMHSEDGKLHYSASEDAGIVNGTIDECPFAFPKIGFNFTFMEPTLKAIKSYCEPKIKIEIVDRAPIRLTFTINDLLKIQYYLAPLQ